MYCSYLAIEVETRGSRNSSMTTHLHPVPGSKDKWSYTSSLPIRLHGMVLSYEKKAQGNFTFTFYIYTYGYVPRM